MNRFLMLSTVAFLLGAGDPWVDASTHDLNGYARALSLDLRGNVPTAIELTEIEAAGEVSDTLLNSWLHSTEFEEQVIAKHRDFFWNELEINLLQRRKMFKRDGIYFNNQRARHTRGALQAHCGDFEADVNELNQPITWEENDDGSIAEGYVEVAPYWDPENPIEVCALDAQMTLVSENGLDCSTRAAHEEPDCGCGPELKWCIVSAVEESMEEAFSQDLTERVRGMLQADAPYTELFAGNTMYMNGPMVHFFRHIARFDTDNFELPVPLEMMPEIDGDDMEFTPVTLADHHDGVLTAPGWLLRHQTNRGRANRFYSAFLCKQFIPAEDGIGGLSDQDVPTPNLIMREGCLGCHARLEPWAAYWGRWSEASTVYRADDMFPAQSDECAACAMGSGSCSDFCEDYYVVETTHEDLAPYIGWYKPYAFLTGDKQSHPDLGPLGWVDQSEADGSLGTCATRNAAQWLLDWEEDAAIYDGWASEFNASLSYRELVRQIVTSPQYWGGTP
jgi:hypothetical protein